MFETVNLSLQHHRLGREGYLAQLLGVLHLDHVATALAFPAAVAFTIGAASMPTCCFLSAWRKPFRHLFFIPVTGVATGIVLTLVGWPW